MSASGARTGEGARPAQSPAAQSPAPQGRRASGKAAADAADASAGGKVRQRDAGRTRASILDAAMVEFSLRGLAGARIDAIAARSGANRRMLYHYFGSKRGLWLAVLEAAYERVRSAELRLDLQTLSPECAMRRLVTFTFDSFVGDRTFINLLNSENLHQARYLRESERIQDMHSPLTGMLADILDQGARAGVFRTGLDPAQVWISIAGLSYFYFSNVFTLSAILGRDLQSAAELAARREHVADFVLAALRPDDSKARIRANAQPFEPKPHFR